MIRYAVILRATRHYVDTMPLYLLIIDYALPMLFFFFFFRADAYTPRAMIYAASCRRFRHFDDFVTPRYAAFIIATSHFQLPPRLFHCFFATPAP